MPKSSTVVIDAGIGIFQVIDDPFSDLVANLWIGWIQDDLTVCAPTLWLNETTSILHKIYMQKLISEERSWEALEALLNLSIEFVTADTEMCRKAYQWASQLNQNQAYDSFYLALAEKLDAEFWTTDQRLVNRARQINIDWAHWIGEKAQG